MSQLPQPPLYRYSVILPVAGMGSVTVPHLQGLTSVTYVMWLVTGCGDSDVGILRTTSRLTQVCDSTLILWPLHHHPEQKTFLLATPLLCPSPLYSRLTHPDRLSLLDFYSKFRLKKQGEGSLLSSPTSWMSLS